MIVRNAPRQQERSLGSVTFPCQPKTKSAGRPATTDVIGFTAPRRIPAVRHFAFHDEVPPGNSVSAEEPELLSLPGMRSQCGQFVGNDPGLSARRRR